MNQKLVIIIFVILVGSMVSIKYVGYVSQGSVPSSVTVIQAPESNETNVSTPSPATGGSGGGSVGPKPDFEIDKDLIHVKVNQGDTEREVIRVTNTGTKIITFNVDVSGVDHLVTIAPQSFTLAPEESKNIIVDAFARSDENTDAYVGNIIISGAGITKEVNVIIEVMEKVPVFDIGVELQKTQLIPGENVVGNIRIDNMGNLDNIEVIVIYALRDFDGNEIAFREESLVIGRELELTRQLNIPLDTEIGVYVFYASVSYKGVSASTAERFDVGEVAFAPLENIGRSIIYIVIIIVLLFFILIILWKRRRKEEDAPVGPRYRPMKYRKRPGQRLR